MYMLGPLKNASKDKEKEKEKEDEMIMKKYAAKREWLNMR